jgi:putative transposase
MPRFPRLAVPDMTYHIICRGNNRDWIFHDDQDFHTYLRILSYLKSLTHLKLYHYALMNNHVHLLLEPLTNQWPLAKIIQSLNLRYSYHYKKRYHHACRASLPRSL